MIWFKEYSVDEIAKVINRSGMVDILGLKIKDIGPDFLIGSMPVNDHTKQIYGILHGGATCVLVESVGSLASALCLNPETHYSVGSVISVNHLKSISAGNVLGICKPVHLGKQKHVWDVQVVSEEDGRLIAKGELTCAVMQGKLDLTRTQQK